MFIIQSENRNLQQTTERLEMELLYMRAADVNGGVGSDEDGEGDEDAGVYKQRYERTVRELEFTRRRLQQQHEDDLEQLVGLKKQLEKKVGGQSLSNIIPSFGKAQCGKCMYMDISND
jgi:myosin-18